MTKKLNCWEHQKCGREPGGIQVSEAGMCPAATEERLHGIHGGKNAGRACWVVAGTLCDGTPKGTFAEKVGACGLCAFYKLVKKEEGELLIPAVALLKWLE